MLKGVFVVGHVVVVVIGVGKEGIPRCKDIRRTKVRRRQMGLVRVSDFKYLACIIRQVLAQLIAQVGVRVAVSDDFQGTVGAYAAMVCGDDHLAVRGTQDAEQFGYL